MESFPNEKTSQITPEMIEAGLEVYLEWHPDTGTGDNVDRLTVKEIYEAMCNVQEMAK